jgi:AhpD family alkylhydroperoxidase
MEPRINLLANELGARIGKRFYSLNRAVEEAPLPKTTRELVNLRVSQINGCGFCVDIHTKELAAVGEEAVRINLVAAWRESTVYTDAERAALALAEEGTRLADAGHGVSAETWAAASAHYDEDQLVALIGLIALMNASNRFNVIVRNPGGSYQPGAYAALAE